MADLTSVRPEEVSVRFSDGTTRKIKIRDISGEEIREEVNRILLQAISRVEKAKSGCYRT